MPNIHGLPMLMTLLFCPTMEPKALKDGSRFAQFLCGLGTMPGCRKSLYPQHDIVITVDTEVTKNELQKVL